MGKSDWTRIDLNNSQPQAARPAWVGAVCGGRNYTWKKGLFQAGQIAAISALGVAGMVTSIEPGKAEKTASELLLGGMIVLLAASIFREAHYLFNGCKPKKEGCLNPFVLLFTAAFVGAIATQILFSVSKYKIDHFEENLVNKEKAFNQSMTTCLEDMINQAPLFTQPPCVPCYYVEEGFVGVQNESVMQEFVVNYDEVLCITPENAHYFSKFVDNDANQTNGSFPCLQELQSENQTWSQATIAYSQFFNIMPPLYFNVTDINATCKRLMGFGTVGFALTELCGIFFNDPDEIGFYDFDALKCITPALEKYMEDYADKIRSFQTSSGEPSNDFYVMDIAPVKMMWGLAAATLVATLGYEGLQRWMKSRERRRPILDVN